MLALHKTSKIIPQRYLFSSTSGLNRFEIKRHHFYQYLDQMWSMNNDNDRDGRASNDVTNNRTSQQKSSKEVNVNGFDGMNYEQERLSYRMNRRVNKDEDSDNRRNLRRQRNQE
jgi:hypothetical protein